MIEAILIVIAFFLLLLCVQVFILILEIIKLATNIQSKQNQSPQKQVLDTGSLLAIVNAITAGKQAPQQSTNQVEPQASAPPSSPKKNVQYSIPKEDIFVTNEPKQEQYSTTDQKEPIEEPEDNIIQEDDTNIEAEVEQKTELKPLDPDEIEQGLQKRPAKPLETETQAVQPSIVECPKCGRENSAFRKTCFHCDAKL